MTDEVGHLQAQLSTARLQEFEAQEQVVILAGELEEERSQRMRAETELQELRTMKDNLGRVSRLVATEMTALRELCQYEKEEAQRMKVEADKVSRDRLWTVPVELTNLLMITFTISISSGPLVIMAWHFLIFWMEECRRWSPDVESGCKYDEKHLETVDKG